jgi:hypothetical protein
MHSKYVVTAALVVAGIIHLLPLSGVMGSARLATLYGLPFDEPNLAILMRHRAMLFGLLGLFLIFAAFRPSLQTLAFLAGFVSVTSFLWLAYSAGQYNKQIAGIVVADVVALVCLIIGAVVYVLRRTATE